MYHVLFMFGGGIDVGRRRVVHIRGWLVIHDGGDRWRALTYRGEGARGSGAPWGIERRRAVVSAGD